jgi:hypothetical protein
MPLYMLIKVDFGHRENIGLFDSFEKAEAAQASMEIASFDNCYMVGLSFYIEEWFVK